MNIPSKPQNLQVVIQNVLTGIQNVHDARYEIVPLDDSKDVDAGVKIEDVAQRPYALDYELFTRVVARHRSRYVPNKFLKNIGCGIKNIQITKHAFQSNKQHKKILQSLFHM